MSVCIDLLELVLLQQILLKIIGIEFEGTCDVNPLIFYPLISFFIF